MALYDQIFKYSDILSKKNYKINDKNKFFISDGSIGVYSPVQFIPQAIGVNVGRMFTNKILTIFHISRIFNLIVCIILLTMAIKIIPSGKKILFLLCLNPIAVEGFSTVSGDGITIALSFLLIAYILSLKLNKSKIKNSDITKLFIMSILLSLCKIVYIIIPFLILLIPRKNYKNKKQFIITILLCLIIPLFTNLLWLFISTKISIGSAPYAVSSKNLGVLFKNPFNFIKGYIYSFDIYGTEIFFEIFSKKLLMCSKVINNTFVPFILIFTFYFLLKEKDEPEMVFNKKDKIIILLLCFGLITAIFLCMYIFWINYNSKLIYGFQGRYLIPIFPIIFLLIKSKIRTIKLNNSRQILILSCLVVNFISLLKIILTYI